MRLLSAPARSVVLGLGVLAKLCSLTAAQEARTYGGASPLDWAMRMADSQIARSGDTLRYAPGVIASI